MTEAAVVGVFKQIASERGWPERGHVHISYTRKFILFGPRLWEVHLLSMTARRWVRLVVRDSTGEVLSASEGDYGTKRSARA